jgi:signal transduction histidine kinase
MKNYLAERNARLEEREDISRNIHNSVGHTITAAVMSLDAAELLLEVDSGKAKERMQTAKERMKEGLTAIRCAVRVLDKESQGVGIEDFIRELSAVTENFMMDTELTVKTDVDVIPEFLELPKVHTEFLTGAVQELLTNGVKHGSATRFLLSVRADSAHLQVSVRDNGGSDFSEENKDAKVKAGFGLKKIVSYLKKCGGEARFTNENGFCAVLTVPLYREETDGEN